MQRVWRRYRQTGQRDALRRGATLSPLIVAEHLNVVQTLVTEQPDALLKELCESLRERTGIKVSVPTMYRAVQRLRLRRKKKDAICQ